MPDDPTDCDVFDFDSEPLFAPQRLTIRETPIHLELFDGDLLVAAVPRSLANAHQRALLFAAAPTLLWAVEVADIFMAATVRPRARRTAFAEMAFAALGFARALCSGRVM